MASDLLVALGEAAVGGVTLFGANHYAPLECRARLTRVAGGTHPLDEAVRATYIRLPQVRQTCAAVGCQCGDAWGFVHGVNENQVAIGVTGWHSRLPAIGGGLTGSDLTRLALERSHNALHALDVLTDLISRHGQCPETGTSREPGPADNVFLVADRHEAFVLEAAGRHWAVLECNHVRAVTDVALIRQDWHRLSPGLASLTIGNGWWEDDGSKVDFAGCLDAQAPTHAAARRRWGRATLTLEQQNGAIDGHFLRRMLFDHHDASMMSRTHRPPAPLASSFMTELEGTGEPVLAWASFGVPQAAVYFPLWLDGDLPASLSQPEGEIWRTTRDLLAFCEKGESERTRVRELLEKLQVTLEHEVESILPQARLWKRQGDASRLRTQTTALMQKLAALFASECRQLRRTPSADTVHVTQEEIVLYFS
jgi:hypothetical protein